MKITKPTIDKAITVVSAGAGFALAILTRHQVISAADATDLGGAWLAMVGAYHGGALVQAKRTDPAVPPLEP